MALIRGDEAEDERGAEGVVCSDCGAPIYASDRSYGFGVQELCWLCAERRGGRYDAHQERWTSAPEVSDLRARAPREG